MKQFMLIPMLLLATSGFLKAQYLNHIYDYDTSGDWGYYPIAESSGNYFVVGSGLKAYRHVIAKRIQPNGI
jgi:hypothetical protein